MESMLAGLGIDRLALRKKLEGLRSRIGGKNEPLRTFGLRRSMPPAFMDSVRGRDPLHSLTRVSVRS